MICGISGFKSSGKDTLADHLVKAHGFTKVSFADKLKDACSTIFEWDREMLEGSTAESREWREEVDEWWADRLDNPEFTPRLALQWMGTEAGRNVFGQNIWCAAMEKFILDNPGNYVIPDVRFRNEVKMIKNMRGDMIRIKRGNDPDWFNMAEEWNKGEKSGKTSMIIPSIVEAIHPSEREWIGEKFDAIIENDGTIDELINAVDEALGFIETTDLSEGLQAATL